MSELDFRIATIKIVAGLEKSREDTRESLSGQIKELQSHQVEIKRLLMRSNKKTEALHLENSMEVPQEVKIMNQ